MRQTNVRGNLSLRGFRKLRTGAIVATGVILLGLGFLAPTVSANEQDGVWVARTVAEVKADIQKEGDLFKYVIKWGDTLSVISEASNIPVDVLQEMNQASGKNLFLPHNELYFTEAETVSDTVTKHKIVIKESGASGEVRTYEVLLKKDKETKAVTFELTDVTEKVEKMTVNYSPVYQPVSAPIVERAEESGEELASEAPAETSTEVKEETEAPVVSKAEAPTTPAPKVEEPATPAPKEETPATPAPKEETPAPKADEPVVPAPKAEAPTTPAPKVEEPATPAPKEETPVTPAPKVEEPATPAPKVEEPATPAPKVEEPATPAPKVEEPVATEPKTEEPVAPAPKAEEPAAGTTPKAEEPAATEPKVEEPATPAPKAEEPATPAPKVEEPATPSPKVEEPATPSPKVEEPATLAPKADEPSAGTTPKADEPSAGTTPKADEPSAGTTPKAEEPAATEPKTEEPTSPTPKSEEPASTTPKSEEPTASAPKDDESASSVESPSTGNHSEESGAPSTTPTGDSTAPKPSDSTSSPVTSGESNSTTQPAGETGKSETTAELSNTPSADATNDSGNTATSTPTSETSTPESKSEEELKKEEALKSAKKESIDDNIGEVVKIKADAIEKVTDADEKARLKEALKALQDKAIEEINKAKDDEEVATITEKYQNEINALDVPGEEVSSPNYGREGLTNNGPGGTTIDNGSTAIGHGASGTSRSAASPTQPSSTSEGASSFRNAPSVQARARRVARSTSEPDGTVNISYNFAGMPDIHGFLSDPGEDNTVTIPAGTSEAQAKELVKEKIQAKIKDLAARGYYVKHDIIFEQDTTVKNYNYVVTFTKEATGTSGFRMAPAVQPRASRNRRSLEQPAPQKVKVNVFYNFDQMKDIAGLLGDINGTSLEIAEGLSNEQVKAAVKSQVDAKKEELSKRGYTFKEDYVYQANGKDYNYVVTFSKATK